MPRSRTDVTGSTITPLTDNADADRRCWRLLVAHHMTSVFDVFNWTLFDFIQLATSLRQSEIEDENALTLEGWHEPLTWVSSAYRCGPKPSPSINWMRSKVYKMNSSGLRTDPCSTPHSRRVMSDRRAPWQKRIVSERRDTTETINARCRRCRRSAVDAARYQWNSNG